MLSSLQEEVSSFVRAVTLSTRSEDRITSRASVSPPHASKPVASTEVWKSQPGTICLLACACISCSREWKTKHLSDRCALTMIACCISAIIISRFGPCASIASHSLDFHSARLTCVTLPVLEGKAFHSKLVVSKIASLTN